MGYASVAFENTARQALVPGIAVAFQPIVNIHSGQCVGFEVLARRESAVDAGAEGLFAADADGGQLLQLEIAVRGKAAEQVSQLPHMGHRRLFLNLDPRLVDRGESVQTATHALLGSRTTQIVTEISSVPGDPSIAAAWINRLREKGGQVALDRFGTDGGGLALLQHCDLDFLKISGDHIAGVDKMSRKRVVLAQVIAMAHTLGLEVIAVGIETSGELTICRELGCDLAQGFFIQPPVMDPASVGIVFQHVEALTVNQRGRRAIDQKWIVEQLDTTPAVQVDTPMEQVFTRIAENPEKTVLPVIDEHGHPLGVLNERRLRNWAYSAFGKDLIANRSLGRTLRKFIDRCPMANVGTPLDQLLAIYSSDENAEGILITEQMMFRGFLSTRSLIRAAHEKNLARARDENPLTRLPGNSVIQEYVNKLLEIKQPGVLAYIDFDYFKPFNDTYGFRQGDRAILLFAELMRKMANPDTWFLGHIGGDDFFVGLSETSIGAAEANIGLLIAKFASDAESFYDAAARQRGFIITFDREGQRKPFPLLPASAVLLEIRAEDGFATVDEVSALIAHYKKAAKSAPSRLVVVPPDCSIPDEEIKE